MPLWTNRYESGNDSAFKLAVDSKGDVIVADGFVTIKYSGAGISLSTNRYNGSGILYRDGSYGLAVDSSDNVFVTGYTYSIGSSSDYATVAYSSAGAPLWTNLYNGLGNSDDEAYDIAVDSSGNVFVTGRSTNGNSGYDYVTIKYASAFSGPAIVSQPQSQTVLAGAGATFSINTTGSSPIFYQWLKDGAILAGATNAVLSLTNVSVAQSGFYSVVVSNAVSAVTSQSARLIAAQVVFVAPATPPTPTQLKTAGYPLQIQGENGRAFRVQVSTNLGDTNAWTTLTNFTSSGAALNFIDVSATNRPQGYYRVVSP